MAVERATRCLAELRRMVDGDTYILLVDLEQRSRHLDVIVNEGAQTMRVRLRDFSAPERGTAAGRVATLAAKALLEGGLVEVELLGEDDRGRRVGWLWVGGVALGPELERLGHARAGAFEG